MGEQLQFISREEFRAWLMCNAEQSDGVWLLFGKAGGPKTLGAGEALEEALCFGWIDGQMKRIDEYSYLKYFSPRRKNSHWSEKNKALVEKLARAGRMTDRGIAKVEEAKQNGRWDAPKAPQLTDEHVALLSEVLKSHEPAHTHFIGMSPSVQKTYARAYFDAKTDDGRASRLAWMVERLNQNLKPM